MMYTVAGVLAVLWVLGLMMGNFGLGVWVHLLLVVAIILALVQMFGKKEGGGSGMGGGQPAS